KAYEERLSKESSRDDVAAPLTYLQRNKLLESGNAADKQQLAAAWEPPPSREFLDSSGCNVTEPVNQPPGRLTPKHVVLRLRNELPAFGRLCYHFAGQKSPTVAAFLSRRLRVLRSMHATTALISSGSYGF